MGYQKLFFILTFLFAAAAPLGGVESPYTALISKMAAKWPVRGITQSIENMNGKSLKLKCWYDPEDKSYAAVLQEMWIEAPLADSFKIVSNFSIYKDLFTGFKTISVEPAEQNKMITRWEQYSGLFFVPNIKYSMIYLIDETFSGRKIFRYQLKEGNYVKYSDGFIALDAIGSRTRYVEFDFVRGDSETAEALGLGSKIWNETVKGLVLSDLDFKVKIENPNMSYDGIHDKADELLKTINWQEAVSSKIPWPKSGEAFDFAVAVPQKRSE